MMAVPQMMYTSTCNFKKRRGKKAFRKEEKEEGKKPDLCGTLHWHMLQ